MYLLIFISKFGQSKRLILYQSVCTSPEFNQICHTLQKITPPSNDYWAVPKPLAWISADIILIESISYVSRIELSDVTQLLFKHYLVSNTHHHHILILSTTLFIIHNVFSSEFWQQMNTYSSSLNFDETWVLAHLPPTLKIILTHKFLSQT